MYVRSLASSAIGAALGVIILLLFRSYYVYLTLTCVLVLPLMTLIGFGREPPLLWFRHLVCCFCTAVLLGGLVYALENMAGITQIPFLSTFCAFILARMMIQRFLAQRKIRRLLIPVILEHHGRRLEVSGLMDTGNLLREPYTGKPVHMISSAIMTELGISTDDFMGLIPCRTVNSSDGLLEIYRIDHLSVMDGEPQPSDTDSCIAKAPAELFIGKEYQLILNSDCPAKDIAGSL